MRLRSRLCWRTASRSRTCASPPLHCASRRRSPAPPDEARWPGTSSVGLSSWTCRKLQSCACTSCCVLAAPNRRMSFSPWPRSCATNMEPRAWRSSWKRPPRFTSDAACSKSGSEREGMTWKTAYRSIYYDGATEPADPDLSKESTALLVIDVQNTYLTRPDRASLSADEQSRYDAWNPFHQRLREIVIPRTRELLGLFRENGYECLFARIACHTKNGRDRSLSQKLPGWNNLLLPKDELPSQLVAELQPQGDEIVVTKTTDSALTGTNLRLILANLGIKTVVCCGIFTDQCVSSTVRSLADESFAVVVVEDCCAAGSDELHHKELEIMNMIYCHVMSSKELKEIMKLS